MADIPAVRSSAHRAWPPLNNGAALDDRASAVVDEVQQRRAGGPPHCDPDHLVDRELVRVATEDRQRPDRAGVAFNRRIDSISSGVSFSMPTRDSSRRSCESSDHGQNCKDEHQRMSRHQCYSVGKLRKLFVHWAPSCHARLAKAAYGVSRSFAINSKRCVRAPTDPYAATFPGSATLPNRCLPTCGRPGERS